jgi:transposase-like protein
MKHAVVALNNKKLENDRIKEFTMQGIEVECPCSRKIKDFVPIRLNTSNKYKCKECQKLISVYITPSTALTTEPIVDTDTVNPSIISDAR